MRRVLPFMICFVLCACATSYEYGLTSAKQLSEVGISVDANTQARRDLFVGRWYDRQNARDGNQTMSLMDIKHDGVYFYSWRILEKDGRQRFSDEKGRWRGFILVKVVHKYSDAVAKARLGEKLG